MKRALVVYAWLLILCTACSDSPPLDGSVGSGIEYPKQDVRIIIPFGRGSASDIFVRDFSAFLARQLAVKVVPHNQKGAGGILGMHYVAGQPADGYTLLEITPTHVIADIRQRTPATNLSDEFVPLALLQKDYYILCAATGPTAVDLSNFRQAPQQRQYTVAGVSPGGLDEMTMTLLSRKMKKNLQFIPYRSGQDIRAALLSGEVDLYLGKYLSTIKYIRSGQLHPLMVLHDQRLDQVAALATVPTSLELGYPVAIQSWRGLAVRKETPKYIQDYLVEQLGLVFRSPEYQAYKADHLAQKAGNFLDQKQFSQFLAHQYTFFTSLSAANDSDQH